ncbi:ABC transporter ATP-binding protein/permease [Microvirga terricola]|uniref:ABC transporter ATP-binding protein/permease n=1 Tax=Microvirga terricola TaxID=2719797 RepID=A0ABX0VAW3_9HYPH|nr:ABC transporter ATP-binding protein/permease [Microvirga terricola]NIX76807.1 ABC transporter ATP-binding protein/permease [Microvirga terricola]
MQLRSLDVKRPRRTRARGATQRPDRRQLFGRFWRTASGFWTGQSRREAWFLTLTLLAIILCQLFVQIRLNIWNRDIFDALDKRDFEAVAWVALLFVPLALAAVVFNVASVWGRLTTQRAWRAWMTDHQVDAWLKNGRYYQLNFVKGEHQNPEFRIADDTRIATESPVDFAFGVTTAVLTAITFISVLWAVGGTLDAEWKGYQIAIPGYLVLVAILYSLVSTTAMVFIGRRFVEVAERKNQAEAEFRYAATRLRENGESIALLGGEPEERSGLSIALGHVIMQWRALCGQYLRTTVVSYGNFVLAPVIPLLLCAPKYLASTMSLGEVMQASTAFVTVQQSFNWLVENYPNLANWTASANRVAGLLVSLERLQLAEQPGIGHIHRSEKDEKAALELHRLSVNLDDGTAVVRETQVEINPGEKVLVVGESGAGKSTLIRAIAGLWPWGDGEIAIRRGSRLFFMPQRPYVPIGTLKHAVAYPNPTDSLDDREVEQALADAGLSHLVDRIHDKGVPWDRTLSGGEQQRLTFAQLFIQKPDIIVMDEATSALDPETQARLLRRVSERLPRAAVISVGHRPELEAFHNRRLVLARRKDGARLVADEALPPTSFALRRALALLFRRHRLPQDQEDEI